MAALAVGGFALAAEMQPASDEPAPATELAARSRDGAAEPAPPPEVVDDLPVGFPMPSYAGQDPEVVRADLRDQGFSVNIFRVDALTVQPGRIERTDPDVGVRITPGDLVTLYVARQPVTAPEPEPAPVEAPAPELEFDWDDFAYEDIPPGVYEALWERGFDLVDGSFYSYDLPISAVTGSPTGSASGRGMRVFFFTPDGYLGTDTSDPSEIVTLEWRDETTIAVSYVLYRDGEPGCCPTGGTQTVRYFWNGTTLEPLDPIPPLDGPLRR